MLDVVRFWLDLGLDGFRLDAVPYLYKRDGTSCENLPATHNFLRRIRAEIDASYPGRILLAEVNQWPSDVTEYFGDGDECHMCFNFPLMPRMFMAVRREQRFPITEILAQTPPIPDGCQWGIFLRNHDELTLEMVTDEERDYMYAEYAQRPADAPQPRDPAPPGPAASTTTAAWPSCSTALLLSLPGSPVLYYGDEMLMGDNIYLGDRDGVRTPMQWSPGPQRRVLPGRLRPALPAPADGPGARLPGRQRRGGAAGPVVVPPLAEAHAGGSPSVPAVRHRARSRCCRPTILPCSPMCAKPATASLWAIPAPISSKQALSPNPAPVLALPSGRSSPPTSMTSPTSPTLRTSTGLPPLCFACRT